MVAACDIWEAPAARSLREAFAEEVRDGLARRPKSLSSAWFYDDRGSRLFEQITEQPEYYLTGCEREILEQHAGDIVRALSGRACQLIEIGAGDGRKTEVLLERLVAEGLLNEFVPVDICRRAVAELTAKLRQRINGHRVRLRGIVAEYFDAFPLLRRDSSTVKLVLFLGSSIGNFGPTSGKRLLGRLRQCLSAGDLLLVGFDLKKDLSVLQRAYDDAAGVTREFNYNLLDRINRELRGRFERAHFMHHAAYNVRLGCMESWLVSRRRQRVPIESLHHSIMLEAWEGIRVERSYKYDLDQIEAFAAATGWEVRGHFFDSRRYFVDSLWAAAG
jgi:L-histidine N-alpha-methyltransferase